MKDSTDHRGVLSCRMSFEPKDPVATGQKAGDKPYASVRGHRIGLCGFSWSHSRKASKPSLARAFLKAASASRSVSNCSSQTIEVP